MPGSKGEIRLEVTGAWKQFWRAAADHLIERVVDKSEAVESVESSALSERNRDGAES